MLAGVVVLPPSEQADNTNNKKKNKLTLNEMGGLHPGSYWCVLNTDTLPVDEPDNSHFFPAPHGPTLLDTEVEPPKLRFAEEFERAPFVHEVVTAERQPSRKLKKARGIFVYVSMIIEKGRPKDAFLKRNNLSDDSHPLDWLRNFLPNERGGKCEVPFSTDDWASFTNTKSMISNTGKPHKTPFI